MTWPSNSDTNAASRAANSCGRAAGPAQDVLQAPLEPTLGIGHDGASIAVPLSAFEGAPHGSRLGSALICGAVDVSHQSGGQTVVLGLLAAGKAGDFLSP